MLGDDFEMETNVILSANNILKLIALVILAGVVFGKISRKVNLPDVVLFILAGVILGPEVLNLINIDSYPVGNQLILTLEQRIFFMMVVEK